MTSKLINCLFQLTQLSTELLGQPLQHLFIQQNTGCLHSSQHRDQRPFHLSKERPQVVLFQLGSLFCKQAETAIHILATVVFRHLWIDPAKGIWTLIVANNLAKGRELQVKLLTQIIQCIGTTTRIKQPGPEHGVIEGAS
ncbi:hypothetical protein GKODMF_10370 [Candidatus Electrothrix gigas]